MKKKKLILIIISVIAFLSVAGVGVYQAKKGPMDLVKEEVEVGERETLLIKSKPVDNVQTAGAFLFRDINHLLYASVEDRREGDWVKKKDNNRAHEKTPNVRKEKQRSVAEQPTENKNEQSEPTDLEEQQSESDTNSPDNPNRDAIQEPTPPVKEEKQEEQTEVQQPSPSTEKEAEPNESEADSVDVDPKPEQPPAEDEAIEVNDNPENEQESEPVSEVQSNGNEAEEIEEDKE